MKHKTLLKLLLAFLFVTALVLSCKTPNLKDHSHNQHNLVVSNPQLVHGTLENGIQYFILENNEPSNRIFLRLVVNVGSILERDDQLGLAHFVEHGAFLGTEDFHESEIVGYLESLGMRFGPDINAYTSFDETVYMLQIPADDPAKLDRGLKILQQWAHAVTFPEERILRERGVILEEWRVGQGIQQRLRDAHFPSIFLNSLYAQRLPIGKPEIFTQAGPEELREFYQTWYRPELLAIVAVGVVDPVQIETQIRDVFSEIPGSSHSVNRPDFPIPPIEQRILSLAGDPELTYASITIYNRLPALAMTTEQDLRTKWTHDLFSVALARRIEEEELNPNFPLLATGAGYGDLVRSRDAAYLYGVSETELLLPALGEILRLVQEVRQDGFTQNEIDAAKRRLLRSYQDSFNERNFIQSNYFASQLTQSFLTGRPAPSIEQQWELAQTIIPTISREDVQRVSQIYLSDTDQIITISVPEYLLDTMASEEELLDFFNVLLNQEVVSRQLNDQSLSNLMETIPSPGSIVQEVVLEEIGVIEWKLSNGMTVYLKPTEFRNDQILVASYTLGGHSITNDDLFQNSNIATTVASLSGLGNFSRTELNSILDGTSVQVSSYIDFYDHGFIAESSRDDLETLFQLIHLQSVAPRIEEEAYHFLMRNLQTSLQARSADPNALFSDTLQDLFAGDDVRRRSLRIDQFNSTSTDLVRSIYLNLFQDLKDSNFFLVGAFQPEEIRTLVKTYLATLPSSNLPSTRVAYPNRLSQGRIIRQIAHGQADASRAAVVFRGEYDGTIETTYLVRALADVLRIRLREALREDEGGTYGVRVTATTEAFPQPRYSIQIDFNTAPDRVVGLTERIHQEIALLTNSGPSADLLQRVQEIHRRDHEANLKSNSWWLWELYEKQIRGQELQSISQQNQLISALTAQEIQRAAELFLPGDSYIQLIMLPGR
jgi:zinc protease